MNYWPQYVGVLIVSLAGLLLYNHKLQQPLIKNNPLSYTLFFIRLASLVMAFHGLFLVTGIKPLWGYIAVTLFAVISLGHMGPFGLLPVVAGYIFYEWLFWFPDKHEWINKEALISGNSSSSFNHLVNAQGTTLTPLRPCGKIRVGDNDIEAFTNDEFIDANEKVIIIGEKPFGVLVEKEKNRTCASSWTPEAGRP